MKRFILMLLLALVTMLSSCAGSQLVSLREQHQRDQRAVSLLSVRERQDTTDRARDSVVIREKGDTVYIERYRDRFLTICQDKEVRITDTLRITERDSVPYPVEVVRYKEKPPWPIWLRGFGLGAVLVIVVVVVWRVARR